MAYDNWDWTFESGSGPPDSFEPIRNFPALTQTSDAGYSASGSKWTKDRWTYRMSWDALLPPCAYYLIQFTHTHRGGIPFYIDWPMGIYGIPLGFGGGAVPGGRNPFDSELISGFGQSHIILAKFVSETLALKKMKGFNAWMTTQALEVIQI
jgi:hypothetical protein